MVFELGLSVGMVLGTPFGSLLEYSIVMLLGLVLGNYFGTLEGSLVVFSLGALGVFIISTC